MNCAELTVRDHLPRFGLAVLLEGAPIAGSYHISLMVMVGGYRMVQNSVAHRILMGLVPTNASLTEVAYLVPPLLTHPWSCQTYLGIRPKIDVTEYYGILHMHPQHLGKAYAIR